MKTLVNSILCTLTFCGVSIGFVHAAAYDAEQAAALAQILPRSKLSLGDGIRQVSKGDEVAISAKFELDDNGKLSLSVYTAEKGLAVDPEHNVLKEFSGSPEQNSWAPNVEVFQDLPHVARASQHLALMAISRHSLMDVIALAKKHHQGMVFSVTPTVKAARPVAVVILADRGRIAELDCDLRTGKCVVSGN